MNYLYQYVYIFSFLATTSFANQYLWLSRENGREEIEGYVRDIVDLENGFAALIDNQILLITLYDNGNVGTACVGLDTVLNSLSGNTYDPSTIDSILDLKSYDIYWRDYKLFGCSIFSN